MRTQISRTSREVTVTFSGHSLTVPKGTSVKKLNHLGNTVNYFMLDDFSFIKDNELQRISEYLGVIIPDDAVEGAE